MIRVALLTLGDPNRITGGYLYHRRIAEIAPHFDAHIDFVSFPDRRFPLPFFAALRVRRGVEALAPEAVLVDSIVAGYATPALVGLRVPLAAILHQPPGGVPATQPRKASLQTLTASTMRYLDLLLYRRAALLITASASLADELAARGFARDLIRVVPPGRDAGDPRSFAPVDLRQGGRCAFLCIANWLPHKGIHDLLEAFGRLPPEAGTLHLAGDADCDPSYSQRIDAMLARPDLEGRVVVHGKLPRDQVAALYRDADVFVLPSYEDAYGTVFGEALAAGLPVVGWWAGNLPNLIDEGVEGFALPPGDVTKLAEVLQRRADVQALRASMAKAAGERGSSLPTWEDTAADLFASIGGIVREKTSSRYARSRTNVLQ